MLTPLIQNSRRRSFCCTSENTVPSISVSRTLVFPDNTARFNAFVSVSQAETRPIVLNGDAEAKTAERKRRAKVIRERQIIKRRLSRRMHAPPPAAGRRSDL